VTEPLLHQLPDRNLGRDLMRVSGAGPPATRTIEEYTSGDVVSVRPYRSAF